MVNNIQKNSETKEIPVEERLRALYKLQKVVSEIDKIRTLRGELPLEVKDLEDEIEGLRTRVRKYQDEILSCNQVISQSKLTINDANAKIAKKEEEKNNVRNNPGKLGQTVRLQLPIRVKPGWILRRKKQ